MWAISWLAEELSTSLEGLCSMEFLVSNSFQNAQTLCSKLPHTFWHRQYDSHSPLLTFFNRQEHQSSCDVWSHSWACTAANVCSQPNMQAAVMCAHTAEHACSCDVRSHSWTCTAASVCSQLNMHTAVMCTHTAEHVQLQMCVHTAEHTCSCDVHSHCWTRVQLCCVLTLMNVCAAMISSTST